MIKRLTTTLFLCAVVLAAPDKAEAGYGFPPAGAWAYGSGHFGSGYSVGYRSRYRAVSRPFGYRSVVRSRGVYASPFAIHGWGGYGNLGFAATTRTAFVGSYHRAFYRPYIAPRVISYQVGFPNCYAWSVPQVRYTSFYTTPVYVAPVCQPTIYTAPIYSAPIYTVPAFGFPTCATPAVTPSISVHYAAAANTASSAKLVQAVASNTVNSNTVNSATVTSSQANFEPMPASLLTAADAILRAGGHREAATAYARLAMRFGSTDQLVTRRFIAQVASGDFDQAEAIVQLADMSSQQLSVADLPELGLSNLLGSSEVVRAAAERLAARAMQRDTDSLSFRTLAAWMQVSGDAERGALFAAKADQLLDSDDFQAPRIASETPLVGPLKTEFVSYQ